MTSGEKIVHAWLKEKGWKMTGFQREVITAFKDGKSGLLNAPTGTGKTNAIFFPALITHINNNKEFKTRGLDSDQTVSAIKATLKMLNTI